MELTRRQLIKRGAEAGLALGLVGTGLRSVLSLSASYPNEDRLASASWLLERIENPNDVRVVDARPALVYRQGHIPNAVNVWDNDINVWGQIPRQLKSLDALRETLGQAGIPPDRPVVAYDGADGRWAPRLLWALEYAGHPDVRLLDGGWPAWQAINGPTSDDPPSIEAATFNLPPNERRRVGAAGLRQRLDAPEIQIVDARPFSAYAEGHVPSAVSWPAASLDGADGRYKRAHALRLGAQEAGLTLDSRRPSVVYSDTGLAAGRAYVALRLLGLDDVRIFDGGWAEWSTLADVPIDQASSAAVSAQEDHRSTCW